VNELPKAISWFSKLNIALSRRLLAIIFFRYTQECAAAGCLANYINYTIARICNSLTPNI
jgi:hypothetical protein